MVAATSDGTLSPRPDRTVWATDGALGWAALAWSMNRAGAPGTIASGEGGASPQNRAISIVDETPASSMKGAGWPRPFSPLVASGVP